MPEEQTETITKPVANGSQVFNVSIRAWLAIMLTATVCFVTLAPMIMSVFGQEVTECKVEEPLYSAFLVVLGAYFYQKPKQEQK